jgi:hypothetical protein
VGGGGKGPSRKKELLTRYFGLICWDPARWAKQSTNKTLHGRKWRDV